MNLRFYIDNQNCITLMSNMMSIDREGNSEIITTGLYLYCLKKNSVKNLF